MTNFKHRSAKFFDRIVAGLHYDLPKALRLYIIVLIVVPIAYFAYLALILTMNATSLAQYFSQSPITAIMFIISWLDLILAYMLAFRKSILSQNHRMLVVTFGLLTIVQIAVGNLISVVLGLIILYLSKSVIDQPEVHFDRQLLVVLIGTIPFYLVCIWLLVTIGIS